MAAGRWLLLLGSNLDDDERVREALTQLAALGRLERVTSIRRLPAHDEGARMYYNVLVALDTADIDREHLDAQLKHIERQLGRQRDHATEVAIDIDILAHHAGNCWQADRHAQDKDEFKHPSVLAMLHDAGIDIAATRAPTEPRSAPG